MESPAVDDDGDCFSPLLLNVTSVNIEVYYNKAVNYTLMVTFVSLICHPLLFSMQCHWPVCLDSLIVFHQVSFLQVLLLIRQMEHSNTQSVRISKSIYCKGQGNKHILHGCYLLI